MATFTASAAQAASPALLNVNGTVDRFVSYSHPLALSAGDVIQMIKVPNGATIMGVVLACSASAGAITVNVGDGNDVSAYGASVVLSGSSVALTAIPYRGLGRSYSAEDTIDIKIAALSAVPGTCKLSMRIAYSLQNGGGQ